MPLTRNLIRCVAFAPVLVLVVLAADPRAATAVDRPAVADSPRSGDPPDTITRYYSLTIRLRPFLLWMTRGDVGGARISWSPPQASDRWVELLVGSDPDRAPMSINRWGFISEQARGDTSLLTGIMTETDEQAIDGARSDVAAVTRGRAFQMIRSTVRNGDATVSIGRLITDTDVTYRHYATLLARFPTGTANVRRARVAPGVETGLLFAVKGLIHQSADSWLRSRRLVPGGLGRDYMYAGKPYTVTLQGTTFVDGATVSGRAYGPAIDGAFEIRNATTGAITNFRILYGLTGTYGETPLRLVYRPRWWVELELDVVDGADASRKVLLMSELSPPRNPNIPR